MCEVCHSQFTRALAHTCKCDIITCCWICVGNCFTQPTHKHTHTQHRITDLLNFVTRRKFIISANCPVCIINSSVSHIMSRYNAIGNGRWWYSVWLAHQGQRVRYRQDSHKTQGAIINIMCEHNLIKKRTHKNKEKNSDTHLRRRPKLE